MRFSVSDEAVEIKSTRRCLEEIQDIGAGVPLQVVSLLSQLARVRMAVIGVVRKVLRKPTNICLFVQPIYSAIYYHLSISLSGHFRQQHKH
jgi:hypothetical protein